MLSVEWVAGAQLDVSEKSNLFQLMLILKSSVSGNFSFAQKYENGGGLINNFHAIESIKKQKDHQADHSLAEKSKTC